MKKTTTIIRPVSQIIRPVSHKAYARFVERITSVISDVDKRNAMLAALDAYLAGDREMYACGLDATLVPAFEMLRFDIDMAMARSAKARSRRRKEVAETTSGKKQVNTEAEAEVDAEDKPEAPVVTVPAGHDDAGSAVENRVQKVSPAEDDRADDGDESEPEKPFVAPVTRGQRRALRRLLNGKKRWRKISC